MIPLVLENISKMLRDRGLSTLTIEEAKRSLSDTFVADFKSHLVKLVMRKLSSIPAELKQFLENNKDRPTIIVVSMINAKTYSLIRQRYLNSEVFLMHQLLFNPMESHLVSPHEILDEEEAERVVQEYGGRKDFPRICTGDRIALHYNMKPNQICKIIRDSRENGQTCIYRLVVHQSWEEMPIFN